MNPFSLETRRVLEANGWHEDRSVDLSVYERALDLAGQSECKPACDFLRRYGDLTVDTGIGEACLNTLLCEIMRYVLVSYFSPEAGRSLYRIGACTYDFKSLLMDSSGNVYRHMDMTSQNFGGIDLFLIAASGEEAIEKLILEDQKNEPIQEVWIAHKD